MLSKLLFFKDSSIGNKFKQISNEYYININLFVSVVYILHIILLMIQTNRTIIYIYLSGVMAIIIGVILVFTIASLRSYRLGALYVLLSVQVVYGIVNYHLILSEYFERFANKTVSMHEIASFWILGVIYTIYYLGLIICVPWWICKIFVFLFMIEYYTVRLLWSRYITQEQNQLLQATCFVVIFVVYLFEYYAKIRFCAWYKYNQYMNNQKNIMNKSIPVSLCIVQPNSDSAERISVLFVNDNFRNNFKILETQSQNQLQEGPIKQVLANIHYLQNHMNDTSQQIITAKDCAESQTLIDLVCDQFKQGYANGNHSVSDTNKESQFYYHCIYQLSSTRVIGGEQDRPRNMQAKCEEKKGWYEERDCQTLQYLDVRFARCYWDNRDALLIVFNDISEKTKAQQLRHMHECLRKIFSNMSHNLKTPLNAVFQSSQNCQIQLSRLELAPDNREKLEVQLQHIITNSDLLNCMISDILDFSKIQNNNMEAIKLDIKEFSLSGAINDIVQLFRINEVKNIKILVQYQFSCSDIQMCNDYNRFKSIMVNILTNSMKFTEKGEVTIKIDVSPEDSNVLDIVISDTGIGMTSQQLSQLFKLSELVN